MEYLEDLPHTVEIHDHVEVVMDDGVRLSARIWMPESARSQPLPAILEYIPYRKRFATAPRDELTHGYLAGHGYVCVRVDLRGSGESEGVLQDEYLQRELDDGVSVLEWIAKQPWCDGNVGMMGISWGGFNALQIAAMQPAALKAVVAASATDDRYADDIHQMGGCMLGDNLSWASVMFSYNSLPPDPALVGDRWRAMWFERLEGSGFWLPRWLRHQRRDDYWRHGSISDNYAAVRCPVYLVSGWADGYTNAVFRMLTNLRVPRKGLVGPWAHTYPHLGQPGPAIDFLGEVLRWWDHWLKGVENGIMDEAMLRAWMQDSVAPTTEYEERPGRWVGETTWPSPRVKSRTYCLRTHRLYDEAEAPEAGATTVGIQSPLSLGLFAGKWCSYASGPDLAHDQRQEDGGALIFQTASLESDIEMLGEAIAELSVSADKPIAMIAARLSDVAPNGEATRLTYGLLNLCHRKSHEAPTPLEPGVVYDVRVRMNYFGQRVPKGNKLRLSLSTSYWPLAFPPPEPVRLEIHLADSKLILPVRPPSGADRELRDFGEPRGVRPTRRRLVEPEHHDWLVRRHLASDESELEVIDDRGTHYHDYTGLTVMTRATELYRIVANDFESASGETIWERSLARESGWHIRTVARTLLTLGAEEFYVHGDIDAYEDGNRVFCRTWNVSIPRDLV